MSVDITRILCSRPLSGPLFFKFISTFTFLLFHAQAFADCGDDWVARVVSVQGQVDVREREQESWNSAELNQTYCRGDTIRVRGNSRAALELHNDTILRLNQNSTLILSGPRQERSWVDLITGALHSISRVPLSLKVGTPFVNADVEGTEFLVQVNSDNTLVGVIEGKVAVSNDYGRIVLGQNESAISYQGKAPVLRLDIKPSDSVQWSLYYPRMYAPGLEQAEQLLQVGQVDEAEALLQGNQSAAALALRSIIAVAKNRKDEALSLSDAALQADASSVAAHLARSYVMQARFDLDAARRSVQKVIALDPRLALAWARLAELYLSTGELDAGLQAAQRAVELQADLARSQTILGFAYLSRLDVARARQAFERSMELDSSDPLARFGQGLAEIREGHLHQGRRYIEIAASLDPQNALIRSYLGKAYYEENRSQVAADQFDLAKTMDPADPTAWYYNAIRLQADNRPVEAMQELEQSIALNDNRAVYRSRQLLDQDAAARSASVARIYETLGFSQLALQEGTRSLESDPTNHSAHRFLSDVYAGLPRHEIARVSELLRSQLLQPMNAHPVQPQLAVSNLGLLDGSGPSGRSASDFNPLFTRDGVQAQVNAVAGNLGVVGDDVTISGIQENGSFSIGQYHYETDGYRANNDLNRDIYNMFVQTALSPSTDVQAELRVIDENYGDVTTQFDPAFFSPTRRSDRNIKTARLGMRHRLSSQVDVLASVIYTDYDLVENENDYAEGLFPDPFTGNPSAFTRLTISKDTSKSRSSTSELQLIARRDAFNMVAGVGNFDEKNKRVNYFFQRATLDSPNFPDPLVRETLQQEEGGTAYWNAYVYSNWLFDKHLTLSMGMAYDHLSDPDFSNRSWNPKLGLNWTVTPRSTIRLAYIEGVGRPLRAEQTLEPTQVAGFNQFFADIKGSKTKRYGIALEHRFDADLFTGIEFSRREEAARSTVSFRNTVSIDERDQAFHRAYAYWTPSKQLSVSAEHFYEVDEGGLIPPRRLETQRSLLGARYHLPSGHFASLAGTYVDQQYFDGSTTGKDSFWLLDAGLGYRFPQRKGSFQIVLKNMLDKSFNYFDIGIRGNSVGPRLPDYIPERQILMRFTYALQ